MFCLFFPHRRYSRTDCVTVQYNTSEKPREEILTCDMTCSFCVGSDCFGTKEHQARSTYLLNELNVLFLVPH